MAHTIHQNNLDQDKLFFTRVIHESVNCGYVKPWRGRSIDQSDLDIGVEIGKSDISIDFPKGKKRVRKQAQFRKIFSSAFAVIFSMQSAYKAHIDYKFAKKKADEPNVEVSTNPRHSLQYPPPVYESPKKSEYYQALIVQPEPPFSIPDKDYVEVISDKPGSRGTIITSSLDFENLAKKGYYSQSALLLKGRRTERILATATQAMMTIGSVLLATALIIMLVVGVRFSYLSIAISGGGLILFGGLSYGAKERLLDNSREQEAALKISKAYSIAM